MAGGIKLAPLMTEIKLDVKNFKSDMEKAGAIGVNLSLIHILRIG